MTVVPKTGFLEAGGLRLHQVAWGDPAMPPVVLIHGMRDSARSWDVVAERLARDHYVVAADLRGHGDSAWAGPCGYSIAAYVFDLADMVATLDLPRFFLVGHSLGGVIAAHYAAAFPEHVAKLCLIEGVEVPLIREQRSEVRTYPELVREWVAAERERRLRPRKRYAAIAEAAARIARRHPKVDAATIAHLARHGLIATDGALSWKYDPAVRHRPPDDPSGRELDEILGAIACPTLLVYGEESWIPLPPGERLRLIRDFRIVTLPGATHWPHHETRAAFLDVLVPFLASDAPLERGNQAKDIALICPAQRRKA